MSEDGADEAEVELPDEILAALRDAALWEDPPPHLEESIFREARATAARPVSRSTSRPLAIVTSVVVGAAAAIALVIGVAGYERVPDRNTTEVALANTPGTVKTERTPSGWRIDLDAPTLPRVDGARHYAAYVEGPRGRVGVGTFNEGDDVILWSGVPLTQFDRLVVVVEPDGTEVASARLR